jgi:predicted nucleotidyltransferase
MTREQSSHSAKVVFLNKNEILSQLSVAAKRLRSSPNVIDVRLFGSLSKENFVPGSDADVLIILRKDSRRMIDRIPEYLDFFRNVPMPVDVFPYTEGEIQRMKAEGNGFIHDALEKGRRL